MTLNEFDDKCVRITCKNGEVFEGICIYCNEEFNEVEYGRREESLDIVNVKFYKNCIKKVESLEDHKGPYGRFSEEYGKFEEETVKDGTDSIEEVLFSEEDEHIYRLLAYLYKYEKELSYQDDISKIIKEVLKYNNNYKVKEEAQKLIEKWG